MSGAAADDGVVVKIGGSLLDLPDLPARLSAVRQELPCRVAWLAGGGRLADEIRDWQGRFHLSEPTAHCLALQTLTVSAELIGTLRPEVQLCSRASEVVRVWQTGGDAVISPDAWFRHTPGWFRGSPRLPAGLLPESWAVTSDTLAACVAIELEASLMLLKSVELPAGWSWSEASRQGMVDVAFPQVAPLLRAVHWVNLRSASAAAGKRVQSGS